MPLTRTEQKSGLRECEHCLTQFHPTDAEDQFCCAGCRFVYSLLHKKGYSDFYRFGQVRRAPAAGFVFHKRDYGWLREEQALAEKRTTGSVAETKVDVQGISCAGCVWLLETVFSEHPGAVSCVVDSTTGTMHLRWTRGECDLVEYAREVQQFGYLLGPVKNTPKRPGLSPLTRRMGICAALALNAMLFTLPRYLGLEGNDAFAALLDLVTFFIATFSMIIGGAYFFRRAWAALRARQLHIDLPIALGLLFAYTGSLFAWLKDQHNLNYFDFVSIFTFLMLLGRWLQEKGIEANRRRLLATRLTPGKVRRQQGSEEEEVEAERLQTDDRFSVMRNGVVPVRSRLMHHAATFALNWINGEPEPRLFHPGSIVPSGARSLEDKPVALEALEDWQSSQLSRLLHIDEPRKWQNAALQKVIRIYLSVVLALAVVGFAAWAALGGQWLTAFQVMISVLVVSCPCAIGVALPLLDDLAAAKLQHYGVFVKEGSLWARLQRVSCLLFDKTGTLTLETLRLANPEVLDKLSTQTKSYLLRLVERSLHPVAACLREELLASGVETAKGDGRIREIAGMGLEWESPVGVWRLGKAAWAYPHAKNSGTLLTLEGVVIAEFSFTEALRPGAAEQVRRFLNEGKSIYLLSGDTPARVRNMARSLGLPPQNAIGGLDPQQKASLVLQRWKDNSLMLGDGANDSLAFDAALCRGTPAVDAGLLEHKADFYLLGRGLGSLGALFSAGKAHHLTTKAVLAFAITYNFVAIAVSLWGKMSPVLAAILMPISSLLSISIVFFCFRHFFHTNSSTKAFQSYEAN